MSYRQISSEYGNPIVRLTLPMNMGLMYKVLFVQHGFESLNFYRESRSSLANITLNITPWGYKSHHILSVTSSLASWNRFISNMFRSVRKAICKWAKLYRTSLLLTWLGRVTRNIKWEREDWGKSSMKEEKNSKLGALVVIFNSHFA